MAQHPGSGMNPLAKLVPISVLNARQPETACPESVQASAERLKSLREKRWDTIEILALPSVARLSGT